jgi:hypothetical protein
MNRNNSSADITMRETKREFTYDRTTVLSLTINRPVVSLPDNPQSQARINRRFQSESGEFYRYAATDLYRQAVQFYHDAQKNNFPFRPYEAFMQYEITYNMSCHLSSYNDRYQYTGGAHGSTVRSSDTFSLKTGRRLPLSHFFRPGFDYRGFLLGQILMQADENMQQNPIYFDDYRKLIVQYFNPESYYLAPAGLVIYYQQYEIAPYSTGIVEFTIPYSVLGWQPVC